MSKAPSQQDFQNMAVAAQKAGEVSQAANQAKEQAGGVKVMGGAAAAAGGVGLLVAGPVAGLALAGGAMYATTRSDGLGDSARACGQGVVGTAQQAKAFNEEHQVTQKVGAIAKGAYNKAKELDDKHKIVDNTKAGAQATWDKAVEVNQKYQVTTKLGNGLVKGLKKDDKHKIVDNTKAVLKVNFELVSGELCLTRCLAATWDKAVEVNQKYQVTTKLGNGLVKGLNKVADMMDGGKGKPGNPPQQ
eukprot:CAMPEP_0196757736 /NCGR_PEP_ID=MMETSP1091-20130531/103817_1 /TAXON_ID=302021 /ORGANISM="Rhodomonas sp., Strain CCMP768" /LENGTH=245 /DNA_ID=CAMNT_0042106521 /DNA_START=36 /DNA_END=775 /DNA_ORIENTATION=+